DRRREGRMLAALVQKGEQRRRPSPGTVVAGDIEIGGPGLLQRQADELAAPLDRWPIIELVGHRRRSHPPARTVYRPGSRGRLSEGGGPVRPRCDRLNRRTAPCK